MLRVINRGERKYAMTHVVVYLRLNGHQQQLPFCWNSFFFLSAGEKKLNKHRTTFHAAIQEC
jgi:hypothetical protein